MTAHAICPTCGTDVEVEIRIAAANGPDGPHIDYLGSEAPDVECHRADVLLWLSTDEGYRFALDAIETARIEGAIHA